jgi:phosphoribosylformylglycinamidine (FGAM) synthase-like amidotransferase family enzyme
MHAPVYHARVTTNNMLLIPLGFVYCDLILTSRIFAAKTFSQIHYQIKSIIKSNPLSSQIHYQKP